MERQTDKQTCSDETLYYYYYYYYYTDYCYMHDL